LHPHEDVGRELVLQQHDGLPARDGKVRGRRSQPVTGRRLDRDVVGAGADQPGDQGADMFRLIVKGRGIHGPGLHPGGDPGMPRRLGGLQQRRA
jgi:hypothetical protein